MSIEDVRLLVAERQRYDDWLSALEARRPETPGHVFERVQADYVGRRSDVLNRLDEHVGTLATMRDELTARVESLDGRLAAHEDERAEAILRTAVGEYDTARWDEVRQGVEGSIQTLDRERATLMSELQEIRTLLSSARTGPAMSAAVAPTPVFVSAALPLLDVDFDDDLDDFVAPAVPTPADLRTPVAAVPAFDEDPGDFEDALSMFSPSSDPGLVELPPIDNYRREREEAPPHRAASPAAATPASSFTAPVDRASPARKEPFDEMAFLRSVIDPATSGGNARTATSGNQPKSLRCTECGTMNFPTEWYCERCGGELAAF